MYQQQRHPAAPMMIGEPQLAARGFDERHDVSLQKISEP
jgi:hypothetical protein